MASSSCQAGPEKNDCQSVAGSGPPPVPVPLRVVGAAAGLDEPRVLVGGVVDHQVHDHLHAAGVHPGQQLVEVGQGAEHRLDAGVVADVVAVVVLRGRVDRRQPQHVDPEPGQVVQPRVMPGRSPTPSPSESAKLRG